MNEHLECVLAIITVIHQRILELYVNICKLRSKRDTHLKKRENLAWENARKKSAEKEEGK